MSQGIGSIIGTGICSKEEAQAIGQTLFAKYFEQQKQQQQKTLDKDSVGRILKDVYTTMAIPFQFGEKDVDGMEKVLDSNSDGQVSLRDIQDLCVRVLSSNYIEGYNLVDPSVVISSQSNMMGQSFLNSLKPKEALSSNEILEENNPIYSQNGELFFVLNSSSKQLEVHKCQGKHNPNCDGPKIWNSDNVSDQTLEQQDIIFKINNQGEGIICTKTNSELWKTKNVKPGQTPFQLTLNNNGLLQIHDKDKNQTWQADYSNLK